MHNIFLSTDTPAATGDNSALNEKQKEDCYQKQPFTLQDLLENGDLDDELEEMEK